MPRLDASTPRQIKICACSFTLERGMLRTVSAVEWAAEMDQYDASMPRVLANEGLERLGERTERRISMAQSYSYSSRTGVAEIDQYDAGMPQVLVNEGLERLGERTKRRGSMTQSSSSSSRTGAAEAQNLNVWNLSSSSSCGWVVPGQKKKGAELASEGAPPLN